MKMKINNANNAIQDVKVVHNIKFVQNVIIHHFHYHIAKVILHLFQ